MILTTGITQEEYERKAKLILDNEVIPEIQNYMKHRHKIHLTPMLKQNASIKQMEDTCDFVIKELEAIKCTLYIVDSVDIIMGMVQGLIDGFKLVLELLEDPDHDHQKWVNEYLKALKEVANEEIHENGIKYKFILIN